MRRRARDREERLSAELSSVKAQLRETVDLLTTKEEEVGAPNPSDTKILKLFMSVD